MAPYLALCREDAAQAAQKHGVQSQVVKHTEAKRGFVLLLRRSVVKRSFAWAARFQRLARDYERLSQTLAFLHYFAFAILMLATWLGNSRKVNNRPWSEKGFRPGGMPHLAKLYF